MENRQLEKQLRVIIQQQLKGDQVLKVLEILEKQHKAFIQKNYSKTGINCTCCGLVYQSVVVTGFGRNQQQALINAGRSLLETLIVSNTLVNQIKIALKVKSTNQQSFKSVRQIEVKNDETIRLDDWQGLGDISEIEKQEGCSCVYYDVHKHHMTQIKNLQARMKLIVKQNQILKQLLLKDLKQEKTDKIDKKLDNSYLLQEDKQNLGIYSNYQQ